jgi:AcrR family transcriptional regulator
MSPRPQKVTDEQLFAATYAVMTRVGPQDLTLAAIASEAGVTPAVIVQRFGSKRGLLLAIMKQFSDGSASMVTAIASQHQSPLAAVRAYAECVAGMAVSPAAFVRSLAYLQQDISDEALRRYLAKHARATRHALQRLIEASVSRGELIAGTPAARVARALESLLSGSLLTWAIHQQGRAAKWLRADVDTLLEPYVVIR